MRTILHAAASVLMWGVFGWYWYVVANRQLNLQSLWAVGTLALISLGGLLLTVLWVAHNKKLASRNRRTNPPPTRPETFTHDTLGRPLAAPAVEELRAAQGARIALDAEERKVYTVGGEVA